jgi:hypothetical protein
MKSASLFKFKKKNRYLIHGLSNIKMGASIASEPFIWIDGAEGIEKVIKQLLIALNNNKVGLPNPASWEALSKEFIKSIGLKSMNELHDEVISLGVMEKDGKMIFTPLKNLGSRKGFINVSKDKIEVNLNAGEQEITKALNEALDRCE